MTASDYLNHDQFYHGTSHHCEPGDLIEPGHPPVHPSSKRGFVYLTPHLDAARAFGRVANTGKGSHVYEVEPTGRIQPDPQAKRGWLEPDLRDSMMTRHPLRVVRKL